MRDYEFYAAEMADYVAKRFTRQDYYAQWGIKFCLFMMVSIVAVCFSAATTGDRTMTHAAQVVGHLVVTAFVVAIAWGLFTPELQFSALECHWGTFVRKVPEHIEMGEFTFWGALVTVLCVSICLSEATLLGKLFGVAMTLFFGALTTTIVRKCHQEFQPS
jgi:hypothetical protein